MIDPMLHVWGWEIPIYLFLGGLVAGLMILSGYHIIRSQWDRQDDNGHFVTAPILSLILLSLGMGTLFLDLEHKLYVWRLYLTFEVASPMSWGSWILLGVYPALIASTLLTLSDAMPQVARVFPFLVTISTWLKQPRVLKTIGFANIALGVLLGIYTGILLSGLGARPLWSSALLGPLFLFSGLSTGAATLHLFSHFSLHGSSEDNYMGVVMSALVHWLRPPGDSKEGEHRLVQADNIFLTVELFILVLYLIGLLSSSDAHIRAAQLLLTGPYAASFWVFVIGTGILLPLLLQFLQIQQRIRSTMIPALLVLFGGLILRFVLVFAGQSSHWLQALSQ